jgi:uncharacterized membrane protein
MNRIAAWLLIAANLLFLFGTLHWLPDTVAVHFDGQGRPDNWMTRDTHALFMTALLVFLPGTFLVIPALVTRLPARWINVPHHSYWTAPERRPALQRLLTDWCAQMATLMGLFMLIIQVLTLIANRSVPVRLDTTAVLASMALFLVLTLALVVRLFRQLRPTR